ncbi:Transposable element Tc1 transposase [Anthophora retusa]
MPKTRELQVTERIQVYERRMEKKSLQQIAVEFGISKGVRKICEKLKNTGKPENMVRTGRKRKTSAPQDRQIVKEVKQNPFISARQIKENVSLLISITQIKSRIHEVSLHGNISRKRPYISKVNAQKRLNFARENDKKPISFWKSIIWSDESKFKLNSNNRRKYVWRKKRSGI